MNLFGSRLLVYKRYTRAREHVVPCPVDGLCLGWWSAGVMGTATHMRFWFHLPGPSLQDSTTLSLTSIYNKNQSVLSGDNRGRRFLGCGHGRKDTLRRWSLRPDPASRTACSVSLVAPPVPLLHHSNSTSKRPPSPPRTPPEYSTSGPTTANSAWESILAPVR